MVREIGRGRRANPAQQFSEGWVTGQVGSYRQHVEKKADDAKRFGAIAALRGHADHDVIVSRAAAEKHIEYRQPREVRARLFLPVQFEEGMHQPRRQGAVHA